MAKTPKKPKDNDIETVPDAWERFEKAIDTVTRTAPKPHKQDEKKGGARRKRAPKSA
jgi:hypothetical protein